MQYLLVITKTTGNIASQRYISMKGLRAIKSELSTNAETVHQAKFCLTDITAAHEILINPGSPLGVCCGASGNHMRNTVWEPGG